MTKQIVMIHGMCCGGWAWDNFKRFFEERGYECHTPTLRHHDIDPKDQPDPALGTTSLLDYAQDLEEYIRKLDEKPLLIGHSMGGLLSQMLGAREITSGLVLLTPSSPSGIINLKWSSYKSFWGVYTKWGYWRNPFRLSFKTVVYAVLNLLPEIDQKSLYEKFACESGRAFFEIASWYMDPRGVSKVDEAKVTCPVLLISGKHDRITPVSVVRKVADKYKTVSTYKEFEDHAHFAMGEPGWEKVAEFISDWLNRTFETRH